MYRLLTTKNIMTIMWLMVMCFGWNYDKPEIAYMAIICATIWGASPGKE